MRKIIVRLALLLAVLVSSFVASAIITVQPDEVKVIAYREGEGDYNFEWFGYIAEPGVYLGDPFAEVITVKIGLEKPTTADYLSAALAADNYRDAWFEAEGPHNPKTKAEVMALVELATRYINQHTEAIARPVTVDEIDFFTPEKGTGRYDIELAHYDYIRRAVVFNMKAIREMANGDDSFLAIVVHELDHSALNIGTGEQLCQLLTLQVLWDMAQDDVPGAHFAFWDELRSWFMCAARYRVEFNHGWYALHIMMSRDIESWLRKTQADSDRDIPRTWASHEEPEYVRLIDLPRMLWDGLLGNPYSMRWQGLDETPTGRLMMRLVEWRYNLRVNGIHVKPGRWLYERGVPPSILRRLFGPTYAHSEWVLMEGERDYLRATEHAIYAGETRHYAEFRDKLRNNPDYFATVWWAYLYGPLQVIENAEAAHRPCRYIVLLKDINDMSELDWMFTFYYGYNLDIRQMNFGEVGDIIYRLLDLKPAPVVERCPKCDDTWQVLYFWSDGPSDAVPVKLFPLAPIVMSIVLLAEWRARRRGFTWRGVAKWLEGLYSAFGQDITW